MKEELKKKIVYYGSISPSAHNTQPWSFKLEENSVDILLDNTRVLDYSDPNKWETYLSMGACLGNVIEAAKALDSFKEYILFPDRGNPILVARVILKEPTRGEDKDRIKVIEKRHTNRSDYLDRTVSRDYIEEWKRIGNENGVRIQMVTDKGKISSIADLEYEANISAFSDAKFRKELSGWIRNNLTKAHDGMPGYITNIPLPMSFLGQWLVKNFNIGKMQGGIEKKWILSAPLIMIVTVKGPVPTNLLRIGLTFEKIVLNITEKGLVYAPLGAVIETPKVSKKLKELLNLDGTPVMLVRVGYSNKQYKKAPKRTVEEVLI